MSTVLVVFIFGVCALITYFIVWTKRSYPFYALKKIKRAKKKQQAELLRLEGRTIVDDLRTKPLLFIDNVEQNRKRKQEKLHWKRGRRLDGLLENWVTSDSNKIFYLRTIRKLHLNVIRVCLSRFLSQRILLLREVLSHKAHNSTMEYLNTQALQIYESFNHYIEREVLSCLCELLDPTEVTEEYALGNLDRITLGEDY